MLHSQWVTTTKDQTCQDIASVNHLNSKRFLSKVSQDVTSEVCTLCAVFAVRIGNKYYKKPTSKLLYSRLDLHKNGSNQCSRTWN